MSVSVVIPVYNSSRFIAETLESVLAQTLPPDEVLVIDDGSTDDTAAIVQSYAPRVRVFRQSNQGQATARNFGAQQASSEWIAFIDHDDLWEPQKLERQMGEIERHPEADLCYTALTTLLQKGDIATRGRVIDVPAANDIRKALFTGVTFLPSSVVVKRSTLLALSGFDITIRKNEDYEMWLRLLHSGAKFAACQEPLVLRRLHGQNTAKNKAWFDECMGIYRRLVLPYLPRLSGWITYYKFLSEHETDLAYTLREQGEPGYLVMMTKSVLHWPFNDFYRYKVLIHMLYSRLKKSIR